MGDSSRRLRYPCDERSIRVVGGEILTVIRNNNASLRAHLSIRLFYKL